MSDRIVFSALDGANALYAALRGDLSLLVARLRSGAALSRKETDFLADYLEGRIKGAKSRGGKERRAQEAMEIGQFVVVTQAVMGGPRSAAILEASQHFKCSERKVEGALAAYLKTPAYEACKRRMQDIGRDLIALEDDPQNPES